MFQLIYVSGATRKMEADDIQAILKTSRERNRILGITGLLVFSEGTFIQVLEGEEKVVHLLADEIKRDNRHRNFMVVFEHEAENRAFRQWSMAFKELDRTIEHEESVFRMSRGAVEDTMNRENGELLLEAVMAFSADRSSRAA